MKRIAISLFLLLAAELNPRPGPFVGSIVYAAWTHDEFVLAGDSRVTTPDSPNSYSYSDSACKISALGGKVLFAATGITSQVGGWNGHIIANREFMRLNRLGTPDDQLTLKLAEAWGRAVKMELEGMGTMAFWGLKDRYITGAVFAEFEVAGELSIAKVEIKYEASSKGQRTIIASAENERYERRAIVLGEGEIITEWADRKTKRALEWRGDINREAFQSSDPSMAVAIKLIALTIDNLPKDRTDANGKQFSEVGPPVAAVRLSRGKSIEWVRQGKCLSER